MSRIFIVVLLVFAAVASASAQQTPANQTQLRLVVVDQTGAGIPAATVIITPQSGVALTFQSDERGVAVSPALTPGPVTVHVEFPGFEPFEAPLTLRRGPMNETVTLKIEGFKEEVAVTESSAPEAAKSASTTTLTQEEIDALPDDPEELAEVLAQMAGPGGATFFMNGFQGGRLPNRDQIRSIRFRQNSYAADNHDAGRTQIEIITRPNTQWGGNLNATFGGDALNARHPQQPFETPSQERNMQLGVRGPVVAGKTSFNFNVQGNARHNFSPLSAIDEFGTRVTDSVRSTNDQRGFQAGLEHSFTGNHGLYLNFQRSENEGLNQGVGGFNLPERASTRLSDNNQFRFRFQSVIGTTRLNEFRIQVINSGNEAFSLSAAPTLVVQEAFTRGGAGVNSNNSTDRVEIADNFDFTFGRHQMRAGLLLEGSWFSNFDERNRAGTWTYRTIEDYLAGRPQQFAQRVGTLDTAFSQYQAGFYWSDEFRLHRDFMLGFGVRNEMQSRIDDKINLMPRIGFTWAPFGSQTSALRGGYGLFHDWYESSLYDQTLRVDGVSVRDIRLSCNAFNAFCAGIDPLDPLASPGVFAAVSGRIQAHPDLQLPRVHQASINYDRQLTANMTVQAQYQLLRGERLMRSRNINAPVDGVRPNPQFGDITQFESTGRSQSDRVTLGVQFRVPRPQQPIFLRVNYTLGQEKNHADGATSLPSDSFDPDVDWGPSRGDIRHRVQVQGQVPLLFGIRSSVNFNLNGGQPYNMTTGRDDNDDGVFNDRPLGVGRNSLRGEPTWTFNLNVSRRINLGGLRNPARPANALFAQQGGGFGGGGQGGRGGGFGGPNNRGGNQGDSRFSMEIFANANNVLNHVTRNGYVGNLSSPLFGQAVGYGAPRDINVGLRFNF